MCTLLACSSNCFVVSWYFQYLSVWYQEDEYWEIMWLLNCIKIMICIISASSNSLTVVILICKSFIPISVSIINKQIGVRLRKPFKSIRRFSRWILLLCFLCQGVLLVVVVGCGGKRNFAWWQQRIPNTVTVFTTARGLNRTFYFPPANCLISSCRWRARLTVGEERRPRLAQELTHSHLICLKLCDGSRLAPLSGALYKYQTVTSDVVCLPFLFCHLRFFFFPPPSAISSCYWHTCSASHCLFSSPHLIR